MEQFGLKTTRAYDKNSIPLCDVENCKVIALRCNNNKINNNGVQKWLHMS